VATLEHTASKNVQILTDTIPIDYLNEKRTLAVYLPENYDTDSAHYSVIYFLDGQSLFDQKIQEGMEWQIDEVLDSLGLLNQEQSIIVGINSSEDRLKEYKPFPSTRWYSDKVVSGDQHAEWIVNSLIPFIDARYRTKKEADATVIAGASLGGLMSYYMLMEYSHIFGAAIVFSPSFWVNEIVYTLHENNQRLFEQKIYFDAGELETPTVESVQKMYDILVNYGMPTENIKVDIEEGEGHWHNTWRKGFKKAYPWIVQGQ
jgi:predicted alpha/beta superfamily hydrolase